MFVFTHDFFTEGTFARFIVGLVFLVCVDSMWLYCCYKRVYEGYYDSLDRERAGATGNDERHANSETPKQKTWTIVHIVLYAVLASFVASQFEYDAPLNAMLGGCLLGLYVFGAFNVTMHAMSRKDKKGDSNRLCCYMPPAHYSLSTALCDATYGTVVTGFLHVLCHLV